MNRGSLARILAYLTSAAAIVPPGTLPRTRSERSKPASMSRATMPTRARRLGALKRGLPGLRCHRVRSGPLSGCWTKRRNCRLPGDAPAYVGSDSAVSSPSGTRSVLSRSDVPAQSSHSAMYGTADIGKNSSPLV